MNLTPILSLSLFAVAMSCALESKVQKNIDAQGEKYEKPTCTIVANEDLGTGDLKNVTFTVTIASKNPLTKLVFAGEEISPADRKEFSKTIVVDKTQKFSVAMTTEKSLGSCMTEVEVHPIDNAATCTLSPTPIAINAGESSTINIQTNGTVKFWKEGNQGEVANTMVSRTFSPSVSTLYEVTVEKDGSTAKCSAAVTVKTTTPSNEIGVAILGDSISTGIFADSQLGGIVGGTFLASLKKIVPDAATAIAFTSGNYTGSQETVFAEFRRENLAAFSGSKAWSHVERIKAATSKTVKVVNLAKIGATIADAPAQLTLLQSKYIQNALPTASYIVFLFGGNDFCGTTNATSFKTTFKTHLSSLASIHPNATILVPSIPNIPQIFTIAGDNKEATTITKATLLADFGLPFPYDYKISCGTLRQSFNSCPYASSSITSLTQKLTDMNSAISQVIAELKPTYPNLVAFPNSANANFIGLPELGADCFHPSELGQKKIADETWPLIQSKFN